MNTSGKGFHVRLEEFAACDSLEGLQRLVFDHLMDMHAAISVRTHTHILNATAIASGEHDAGDVCHGVSGDMVEFALSASVLSSAVTVASMRIAKEIAGKMSANAVHLARPTPSLDDRGEESQVVPEEPDCGPPDHVLVW